MTTSLLRCTVLAVLAPFAAAQGVTPTHTSTTPIILPEFDGSVVFATMIAPEAGETIVSTDLLLVWTTDGTQSAELFELRLGTNDLASGPSPDLVVVGADLGWGSAPGTYSAVVTTDLFNGTLASGLPGFPTTFQLEMDADGGGGLWGELGPQSRILFRLGPHMKSDLDSISLSTGGTQTLDVTAGPDVGPGLVFLACGSASGTAPVTVLDGVNVPLVVDSYTLFTVQSFNSGPYVGTLGVLDAFGLGQAQIVVPPFTNPSLAGLVLHHSALVFDPSTGELLSATNPVVLQLLP